LLLVFFITLLLLFNWLRLVGLHKPGYICQLISAWQAAS